MGGWYALRVADSAQRSVVQTLRNMRVYGIEEVYSPAIRKPSVVFNEEIPETIAEIREYLSPHRKWEARDAERKKERLRLLGHFASILYKSKSPGVVAYLQAPLREASKELRKEEELAFLSVPTEIKQFPTSNRALRKAARQLEKIRTGSKLEQIVPGYVLVRIKEPFWIGPEGEKYSLYSIIRQHTNQVYGVVTRRNTLAPDFEEPLTRSEVENLIFNVEQKMNRGSFSLAMTNPRQKAQILKFALQHRTATKGKQPISFSITAGIVVMAFLGVIAAYSYVFRFIFGTAPANEFKQKTSQKVKEVLLSPATGAIDIATTITMAVGIFLQGLLRMVVRYQPVEEPESGKERSSLTNTFMKPFAAVVLALRFLAKKISPVAPSAGQIVGRLAQIMPKSVFDAREFRRNLTAVSMKWKSENPGFISGGNQGIMRNTETAYKDTLSRIGNLRKSLQASAARNAANFSTRDMQLFRFTEDAINDIIKRVGDKPTEKDRQDLEAQRRVLSEIASKIKGFKALSFDFNSVFTETYRNAEKAHEFDICYALQRIQKQFQSGQIQESDALRRVLNMRKAARLSFAVDTEIPRFIDAKVRTILEKVKEACKKIKCEKAQAECNSFIQNVLSGNYKTFDEVKKAYELLMKWVDANSKTYEEFLKYRKVADKAAPPIVMQPPTQQPVASSLSFEEEEDAVTAALGPKSGKPGPDPGTPRSAGSHLKDSIKKAVDDAGISGYKKQRAEGKGRVQSYINSTPIGGIARVAGGAVRSAASAAGSALNAVGKGASAVGSGLRAQADKESDRLNS